VLELELGARFGGDQLRALHLELLLDELGQRGTLCGATLPFRFVWREAR
jgi:hypothetical protein